MDFTKPTVAGWAWSTVRPPGARSRGRSRGRYHGRELRSITAPAIPDHQNSELVDSSLSTPAIPIASQDHSSTNHTSHSSRSSSVRLLLASNASSPIPTASHNHLLQSSLPLSGSASNSSIPATTPGKSSTVECVNGEIHRGPKNYHGKQQPPDRPGFGSLGRQVMLRTNFLDIRIPKVMTIYHYDISITPETLPKNACREVYAEFQQRFLGDVIGAYDGGKSVFYAREPFNGEVVHSFEHCLSPGDRPKPITIKLKKAAVFDVTYDNIMHILRNVSESMPVIQALDVILGHLPSLKRVPIGRSFFSKPAKPFNLGAGREVWSGYYQGVRPVMGWKLMLNVDTAAAAFYTEQSVFDFMCTLLTKCSPHDTTRPLTDRDRQEFMHRKLKDFERRRFSQEIKGLKIVVSHLSYPRMYKVIDVTKTTVKTQTFPLNDGSKCTVEAYFKKNYPKSPIKFSKLPCLQVGQKNRNVYLPIEVCTLVGGQRCLRKLGYVQRSNMIRHTTISATQCEQKINEVISEVNFGSDEVVHEFGIKVGSEMMKLKGRVLDPPKLIYRNEVRVQPKHGKGSWDMQGGIKFFTGATVRRWAVLVCSSKCGEADYKYFIDELCKISLTIGINIKTSPKILQERSVEGMFHKVIKEPLDLIMAIIDRGSHYNTIKRLGDDLAVTTQCVLTDTVQQKCNRATLTNICLKINALLGGVNSIVDLGTKASIIGSMPVIIFGADVTHPRSGDTISPSIASVVASVDMEGGKYRALHFKQKNRQEIIADLKEMAIDHLKAFWTNTGKKPLKIIFYRDGVSEGQFDAVRTEEIAALQAACLYLQRDGSYQPKITFIVLQKRHHTRFFPESSDTCGKGGNILPGTTVDSGITHPIQHDFYLCSHLAIQGTSRPCHYHVLWDDSDFSANDLQLLSYQLCHIFWKCTRSVSYPAPTYYAHCDAAHARMLLQTYENSSSRSKCETSDGISMEEMNSAIEIHKDRKNKCTLCGFPLFFSFFLFLFFYFICI